MKISQIFYWNCRWKRHVEEGFLYVCFYLGIHCFFQLLGGSFRLIFFALISRIFCQGRISNAALQNYFSMPLKEYSERSFVFLPFSANMSMACFFYLVEATRRSLNFLPNKFLSSCPNKSASYFNISLDCCAGQVKAAKILYLLKYML